MNNPPFCFLAFTVFFLRNDCTRECPPGNARVGICPEIGMTAVEDFLNIFSCFFQMYCDSRREKIATRNEASKYIIQYG